MGLEAYICGIVGLTAALCGCEKRLGNAQPKCLTDYGVSKEDVQGMTSSATLVV